jgi:hypothetical protein
MNCTVSIVKSMQQFSYTGIFDQDSRDSLRADATSVFRTLFEIIKYYFSQSFDIVLSEGFGHLKRREDSSMKICIFTASEPPHYHFLQQLSELLLGV